jgi:hypothetical protein
MTEFRHRYHDDTYTTAGYRVFTTKNLHATDDVQIDGDVVIDGNLTVKGTINGGGVSPIVPGDCLWTYDPVSGFLVPVDNTRTLAVLNGFLAKALSETQSPDNSFLEVYIEGGNPKVELSAEQKQITSSVVIHGDSAKVSTRDDNCASELTTEYSEVRLYSKRSDEEAILSLSPNLIVMSSKSDKVEAVDGLKVLMPLTVGSLQQPVPITFNGVP